MEKEGTRLYSHNQIGECYEGGSEPEDAKARVLQFEQQTQLTCKVNLNRDQLEQYCTGAEEDTYKKWKIFQQLKEKLQYVAQFGSPSLTKQFDWVKILPAVPSPKTWSAGSSTCSGVIGYDVKFLYSVLGFENQLQKYIVGAKIEEIKDDWVYFNEAGTPTSPQAFNHIVQVSFHQVLPLSLIHI